MRQIDLSTVKPAGDFKSVRPGGYVCQITQALDMPSAQYLKLEYDIAEGEFKNYYDALFTNKGFWGAKFNKSYKDSALPFFKSFITAVEESNKGFKWQDDETQLRNKYIGLVLGEEEYTKNDGTVGTRLYVDQTRGVESIRSGKYTVPAKKCLSNKPIIKEMPAEDNDFPDWLK